MAKKCPKCNSENPDTLKFCGECGTQLIPSKGPDISKTMTLETPAEELTRGTLFAGRYDVIEKLGSGGMGSVYRAYDKKIEEEVALKLIRPDLAAERKTIDRFRNEIKIARKIRHASVCAMHDLHLEGNTYFFTMEYVPGEDLKSLVRRTKALTVGTAISIARQVADGLGEAHKLGIVHRDLKPGNIMIDKEGKAKVMDFGIARIQAASGTTAEGVMIGTPEYMSPEQVEGKPADVRSDLYALGVILFEMVTGQAPFEGDTPLSVAHKHRYEPPPNPQTLNAHIPIELNRIILRLLEKEREKRYQNTEELIADLKAAEDVLPKAERSPAKFLSTKRKAAPSRKITVEFTPRKLLVPVLATVAIVAIIIVLTKVLPRKEPTTPTSPDGIPSVAVLYFKNNTGEENLNRWREGLSLSLTIRLSQSRYFRVLDQSQVYGILKRLNLLEQDSFTPEELKEIATRGLATHIVRGSLSKAGERFRIDLTLQNASTLEIIAPESADGTGEESILDMVDNLAEGLKTNLGITAQQQATDISRDIRDVYTKSDEAFEYYIQGSQLMISNPTDPSIIAAFEKAIAADPQFAMAYLMLAVNFNYRMQIKECVLNVRKAFDLRERVSEREKYLIEASYFNYASEGTWNKAIDAYSKLISLYPWDLFGNCEWGYLYTLMDKWDKAIERFEVSRYYKDENSSVYHQLAWSYLAKGRTDKAREVLEDYLNTIGDNNHLRANLGMVYCVLGDLESAKREIDRAYGQTKEIVDQWYKLFYLLLSRDFAATDKFLEKWEELTRTSGVWPSFDGKPMAYAAQGKIKEARASFTRELEKWQGIYDLFYFENRQAAFLEKIDNFPEALSACKRLAKSVREVGTEGAEWAALYRRGIILARQGRIEEAERTAEELLSAIENGPVKNRIRYYDGLLGLIALLKKDPSTALAHLQAALTLAPIEGVLGDATEFLDFQAEAYELAGRWEDARKSYEKIQSIKIANLWPANALIMARSYYKLGKVLERLGDKSGAASNYRHFLDLWKDADPGLPEVEDARARLASLE